MTRFKTTPFAHQLKELDANGLVPSRALFWEMGTGKTKATLDNAALLCRAGCIDGLLVVAPNGVHQNWVLDEIPAHLPDGIRPTVHGYSTHKAGTKAHDAALRDVTAAPGFAILAMSYDAVMTKAGRRAIEEFLNKRRCLFILDESQRIKTPGAKRTLSLVALGRRAKYKRILTGTPVTNKPFDVYAQFKFLDEGFWKAHGFASYEAFKVYFGVWEQRVNHTSGGRFEQVVAFRNLDKLAEIVATISSRVLKQDVLDLPPKVYEKRYFELTPEQAAAYKALRDQFLVELDGAEITAPLMVTRLLRFQQITSGFLPVDPEAPLIHRFAANPRLRALEEILEDLDGQAIIFARFREDVDQICGLLGPDAVRYDGATGDDDRLAARQRFQAGEVRYFVGNPAAAGVGLTLHAASTVVYYSNSFDLEQRLQSEDRAHRIGQTRTVTYIDLIAKGTVDQKIVAALRDKLSLASIVTRDAIRTWI